MRKTILATACATLIGLASIASASAQMTTGTNEGMSKSPTASNTTNDGSMNAMNKMKKKKMKKGMMKEDGMSGGMDKGGMSKGGMMEKKM